jgi:GxxExxY protein
MNLETRKPGREFGNTDLTDRLIAAAIRVHKELGPGFLEIMYEEALAIELAAARNRLRASEAITDFLSRASRWRDRLDLVVEGKVIVELKAISNLEDIHYAIVRSYLKAANLADALLLNFATMRLLVKRVGREYHPKLHHEEVHL